MRARRAVLICIAMVSSMPVARVANRCLVACSTSASARASRLTQATARYVGTTPVDALMMRSGREADVRASQTNGLRRRQHLRPPREGRRLSRLKVRAATTETTMAGAEWRPRGAYGPYRRKPMVGSTVKPGLRAAALGWEASLGWYLAGSWLCASEFHYNAYKVKPALLRLLSSPALPRHR